MAAEPAQPKPVIKQLGAYGVWRVYKADEGGQTTCFASAKPLKAAAIKGRGAAQFLITHRPAESAIGVVNVAAGYRYLLGSDVSIIIDKERFTLFTEGGNAWTRDAVSDRRLVATMRKNRGAMIVRGRTRTGKTVSDSFSLAGVSAAWKAMNDACGVRPD